MVKTKNIKSQGHKNITSLSVIKGNLLLKLIYYIIYFSLVTYILARVSPFSVSCH